MKHYVVTERKHGVSLHIEDTANMTRQTLTFTWPEWSGLVWAVDDTRKNPNFKLMEPKAKKPTDTSTREFVKTIILEDSE